MASHPTHYPQHNPTIIWLFFILIVVVEIISKNNAAPFFFYNEQPHYIGVSWNMWSSHQGLLLEDNNGLYINKPPLLFWLINALWALLGVKQYTLLTLQGVLVLFSMGLTQKSFSTLWPLSRDNAWIAPALLLGFAFLQVKFTCFNFEPLVVACATICLLGCCQAMTGRFTGWLVLGLGMGLGLLSKGPVILFFSLLPAIPIAIQQRHLKGFFISLGIATLMVLAWLIPLYHAIGPDQFNILIKLKAFGGTTTYGAAKPWWFYLAHLPAILMPWILWPQLWYLAIKTLQTHPDKKMCFLLTLCCLIIVALSCVGIKRARYILALLPWISLLFAYWCAQWYQKPAFRLKYTGSAALIALVFLSGLVLTLLPFVVESMKDYPITFAHHTIPGIVLLILSIGAWCLSRNNLTVSILIQLTLMSSLMCTTWVIDTLSQRRMEELNQIVLFLQKHQDRPIVYIRHYGGYLMRVGDRQMPEGANIPENQLNAFLRTYPKALIVDKACHPLYPTLIQSPSTCITVRQGQS